ncbi:MAG: glucans biosynthesis glucosyltransferase MdoH, partial [Halomonas sp.]|nr:glucans biosynthesis glucosyltransferase MdoH [Halomonas sp.]
MPENREAMLSLPWLRCRRAFFAIIVVATSIAGSAAMVQVVTHLPLGWQIAMLTLFVLTFSWVALAFWGAVCGFVLCMLRLDPLSLRRVPFLPSDAKQLTGRTALVMPIYAEPPIPTIAGLEATCRSLLHQAD